MSDPAPIDRTRPRVRDTLSEALTGLVQRPARSALTMLGTLLGVGAFVAVLGLTSTATGQIGHSFNVLEDTTVTIHDNPTPGQGATARGAAMDFPQDSDDRLQALNGVLTAGVWWVVPLRNPLVSARPDLSGASTARPDSDVSVYALSPGAVQAMQPRLAAGTVYNAFHQSHREHVCLLGAAAARQLGISRVDNQPAVFVNGVAYTVLGIVADTESLPQTLLGMMIPSSTALSLYGPPVDSPAQALVHTRLGAAQLIARQAPLALRPDQPGLLQAVPPPDPHSLRDQVSRDLSSLFLVLAAICLVIGAVGIANTTLVAVLERTGEIGLRRSMGARPRHIATQFLAESTALGLLGGLVGTSCGVATVVATALAKHWTAVIDPLTVLPAPLIGAGIGLLAGLYPALRAARIEPLEALRH
ncbi:ABC transporter permease [Streptacidiphilus rugosus]|uniref:ABC transporter permease n=1 Tax=Streptacidiphilus rugosus TaxID=405783 RepID=UPI0005676715|nr:FtsX-like permease family protein [Streptacidiphilus rugosus]